MRQYLSLLSLAAAGQLVDQKGRAWPDLTDAEAAAWLTARYQVEADAAGVERTRGLLMGRYADPLSLADRPLVYMSDRRTCRASGEEDAAAYRVSPGLVGFEPEVPVI